MFPENAIISLSKVNLLVFYNEEGFFFAVEYELYHWHSSG